jgi:hypothetical protein
MKPHKSHKPHQQFKLFEGLRSEDLAGMVSHRITIDQYTSKMGNGDDIIVVAFKVKDKFPAIDLMEFIEKGYPFVLDADMSTGEESDGQYSVFVELERNRKVPEELKKLLRVVGQLCKCENWRFKYFKDIDSHDFSPEAITQFVPLDKETYKQRIKEQKMVDVAEVLNQGGTIIKDIDSENNVIISKTYAGDLTIKLEEMGQYKELKNYLTGPIQLDNSSNSQTIYLEKHLGNYEIHKINNRFLLRNGEMALIFSKDTW